MSWPPLALMLGMLVGVVVVLGALGSRSPGEGLRAGRNVIVVVGGLLLLALLLGLVIRQG